MVSMCHLKCVSPYGVHVSPKMCGPLCIHLRNPLQNQWQNDAKSMNIYVGGCLLSHVGSRWHLLEAMLAQDDLEDRFFIDFWNHFGYQNNTKIYEKMKWFSDALKNCVFCAGRPQRRKNGGPKGIQNQAFSGISQNYRIVLPPARGASFKCLKGSQTLFFPGPFS